MANLTKDDRSVADRARDEQAGIVVFSGLGDPDYHGSYAQAAELLEEVARARGALDAVALPLFFLQRHALELSLKELISSARSLCHLRAEVAARSDDEWRAVCAIQSQERDPTRTTHDLRELVGLADTRLSQAGFSLPEPFAVLADLIDESFEHARHDRSRYPTGRKGSPQSLPPISGDPVALPVGEIGQRLESLMTSYMDHRNCDNDTLLRQLYEGAGDAIHDLERLDRM